jgi:tetratricopeptide (TPR) repeat protein
VSAAGAPAAPGPVKVFCSYAPADLKLRDELGKHLAPMCAEGLIVVWHDRQIEPGKEVADVVDEKLESAGIILLLISPDFIASKYSDGKEVARALERAAQGTAVVVPIVLEPVDWGHLAVAKYKPLPANGVAISSWPRPAEALADVALGLRALVEKLNVDAPPDGKPPPIAAAARPATMWTGRRVLASIAAGLLAVLTLGGIAFLRPYVRSAGEGDRYLDVGRPDEADRAFQRALGYVPFGADAQAGREKAHLWAAPDLDPVAFGRALDELARRRPDDPHVQVLRGHLAYVGRDFQAAIRYYDEARRRRPGLAEAYWGLGCCYEAMGRDAEALPMYERAVQISPQTPRYLDNLAALRARRGDVDGAIAAYRRIVTDYPLASVELAKLLWARNNLAGARAEQRKALLGLVDPKVAATVENRGRWSFEGGDVGGAPAKTCYVRLQLSATLCLEGKRDEANGEIDRVRADCPRFAADLGAVAGADLAWLGRQAGMDTGPPAACRALLASGLDR